MYNTVFACLFASNNKCCKNSLSPLVNTWAGGHHPTSPLYRSGSWKVRELFSRKPSFKFFHPPGGRGYRPHLDQGEAAQIPAQDPQPTGPHINTSSLSFSPYHHLTSHLYFPPHLNPQVLTLSPHSPISVTQFLYFPH